MPQHLDCYHREYRRWHTLVGIAVVVGALTSCLWISWQTYVYHRPLGMEYQNNPHDQLKLRFQRDMQAGWTRSAWQALSPEAKARISWAEFATAGADPVRIAKLFQDAQIPPPSSGKVTWLRQPWRSAAVEYSVTEDVKIYNFRIIPRSEISGPPPPRPHLSLPIPTALVPPPPSTCAALEGLTAQDCAVLGTLVPEALSLQAHLNSSTSEEISFGMSVAVWGNTVLVGAIGQKHEGAHSGAVYVFTRTGTTWAQQALLTASNPSKGDVFGMSVAIWGDTAVVGSINPTNGRKTVSVFTRTGTTWSEQAALQAAHSRPHDNDSFGYRVAIWGDTIVAGTPYEASGAVGVDGDATDTSAPDAGAVYVFARSGTTWTEQAYLKASNTYAGDLFGSSVAICGDIIVVGAPEETSEALGVNGDGTSNSHRASGAAYVFRRMGTTWSNQAYLKAPTTRLAAEFGSSVAVWGDTIVVGAKRERSAAPGAIGDHTDTSLNDAGAAYIFGWRGTTWTQEAYLRASTVRAHDRFGWSVAIWDNAVAVGALDSPHGGGAISVFGRDGTTWKEQAILKAPPTEAQGFGRSVAISGDTMISGPASVFVGSATTASP